MEHFFKNREEVEKFFLNEYFVFSFTTDGTIYFNTIRPINLGGEYFNFELSFYYEDGKSFFNYCSFTDWLDQFQLSEVVKINEIDNSREILYFKKYETT